MLLLYLLYVDGLLKDLRERLCGVLVTFGSKGWTLQFNLNLFIMFEFYLFRVELHGEVQTNGCYVNLFF